MIKLAKQDLTTTDADFICHQVNCRGKMNSGVAKAIRKKWPIVYETYNRVCNEVIPEGASKFDLLGRILYVNPNDYTPQTWPQRPIIINMFAQQDYGYDGKRYTSYDAFWSCLSHMLEAIPKGSKVAFPYKIGCDRGGANWKVIYAMIAATFGKNYDVEICYLEEDDWIRNRLGE